jgi:hypothetical protein
MMRSTPPLSVGIDGGSGLGFGAGSHFVVGTTQRLKQEQNVATSQHHEGNRQNDVFLVCIQKVFKSNTYIKLAYSTVYLYFILLTYNRHFR